MQTKLISKHMPVGGDEYSFNELFRVAGRIKTMYIASAYSDVLTLRKIFRICRANRHINNARLVIFLDQSANKALPRQIERQKYLYLATQIRNEFGEESGINLVNQRGFRLFHSKMIFISSTKETKIIVGSINMTRNGTTLHENEELIISLSNPTKNLINKARLYFDDLMKNSISVRDAEANLQRDSLRSFFLAGKLYVKYNPISVFYFPLNLPEEVLNSKNPVHKLLDEKEINDRLNILKIYPKYKKIIPNRESWSNYCIETIHGFWTPYEFIEKVDTILLGKRQKSDNSFARIIKYIFNKDSKFSSGVNSFFEELDESIRGQFKITWDIESTHERWHEWYKKLKKKFYRNTQVDEPTENHSELNKDLIDRLRTGVQQSDVFDFFTDYKHRDLFVDSFYDSLQFHLSKPRTPNKIAQIVRNMVGNLEDSVGLAALLRKRGVNSFSNHCERLLQE